MKNWPLKKQVIGLVSVLLSLMLLLGGNGSLQQIIINKNVDLLQSDALPGVETLPKIYGQILEIRGNVVAASLGGSHDQFAAAEQQARTALKDYENFLDVDEPQMYAATVRASNAYLQLCDHFAELNSKGMTNEARQLWSQSEPAAFLAFSNAFRAEIDFNNGLAAKFSLACQNSLREDAIVSWVLLILCLAVGFLLVRFLMKQIDRIVVGIAQVNGSVNQTVSQLRGASDSVADTASRVSASSQSLSQSSQEQAASLEQTSTSTQVITASTIRNAEHAQQATLLMGSVVEKINGAGKALEGLIASMSEIADSSDKISSVTEAIEQIAFQTNMLAINAAVEAAHAGAAGRGFAIVALEVRDLATRCAQAAKDTKALISRSVTSSSGGSDRVQQVAAAARTVAESALSAKTLIDEVSRSNSEHSRGVEQISLALGQMESSTQNTVANAEQTAAASRQLSDEAAHLQEIALALEQRVKGLHEAMLVLS